MRAWAKPSVLAIILAVDGLLSFVFGMVSYFSATSTYATIIDLSGMQEDSLMAAVLGSLSVFYVVIGALCLLAAFMRRKASMSSGGCSRVRAMVHSTAPA